MEDNELDAIERRLEKGDLSRAADDIRALLAEVMRLRGFLDQAEASAVREVLRDPPIP